MSLHRGDRVGESVIIMRGFEAYENITNRCQAERKKGSEAAKVEKVCHFCGRDGGAMKSTKDGKVWGHGQFGIS